jgi:uncharacterized repeat protein (TIGR03803 family)
MYSMQHRQRTIATLRVACVLGSGAMIVCLVASAGASQNIQDHTQPTTRTVTRSMPSEQPIERVLWSFSRVQFGHEQSARFPAAGLIADATGALYGTTSEGGGLDSKCAYLTGVTCGTVFKLTRSGSNYTESVLWIFNGDDGETPLAALIADKHGALYGTTFSGGAFTGPHGYGTVFKLTPSGTRYTFRGIWDFWADGTNPLGALIADGHGALYGTTSYLGDNFGGSVFKLTRSRSGYQKSLLWLFGSGQDGAHPAAAVIAGRHDTLYGTTEYGGMYGLGTVFMLTPSGSGYAESVLWSFGSGQDGAYPVASLIAGKNGALYGTTMNGGRDGLGTVFMLTPSASSYMERILYSFQGRNDGAYPYAGLIAGKHGALYGTTEAGGRYGGGTVFKLKPSGSSYTERVLWSFGGGQDGANPVAGLIADATGSLYGTTKNGGRDGLGTAFKLTP